MQNYCGRSLYHANYRGKSFVCKGRDYGITLKGSKNVEGKSLVAVRGSKNVEGKSLVAVRGSKNVEGKSLVAARGSKNVEG